MPGTRLLSQFLALLACLLAIQAGFDQQVALAAGKPAQVIDQQDPIDIEFVARAVCAKTRGQLAQISRVSTIALLADYFENQITSEKHRLFKCKQQHGEALNLLHEVVSVSNENVCSDTKIYLIEDFHIRFVSTHAQDMSNRRDNGEDIAPRLLRLFFMHYTMEVDSTCKRGLINNLEWDLKEKFGDNVNDELLNVHGTSEHDQAAFKSIFGGAMNRFTALYSVKNYDGVLMIWDLIENSYLNQKLDQEHQKSLKDEYDLITGEPIRLLVKVKTARYLNMIKDQCHYSFKPIYSALILPIMRLANLGYSNSGEQFRVELDELRQNDNVRRWYGVTQLCEAMLPIKFYENPAMEADAIVVITKAEAVELDEHERAELDSDLEARQVLEYEPETNSMEHVDLLESVASQEAQKLVDKVDTNLNSRDRTIRRAIVHMLHNLKHSLASTRIGRFFFSKVSKNSDTTRAENKFIQEDVGRTFGKALNSCSEEDLLRMNGAASSKYTERFTPAQPNAKGIGARRIRSRKGDQDAILRTRAEAISKVHVMSWSEVFAGWGSVLAALAPSRMQMIIVGGVIIGMLFIIACAVVLAATIAA